MAYRWNSVECDTYDELIRLQTGQPQQAEVSSEDRFFVAFDKLVKSSVRRAFSDAAKE